MWCSLRPTLTISLAKQASSSRGMAKLAKGARDHPWRQWKRLQSYFQTGQVCVIDGANGTEIQRRGGRPAETFSSGIAPLARPDLCQEVHQAYLDAGADVLITHTYSANGNVMSPSGNGGRVSECILSAAAIARRACLQHASTHAAQLAHTASASAATAAFTAAAASNSAARATTSLESNEMAHTAASSSVDAITMATDSSALAQHAMREVHACAAAANAAAAASLAASEDGVLLEATTPVEPPDPVATQGWDSSGFGPALVVGSLSTHPPEMKEGGAGSAEAKWPSPEVEEQRYFEAAKAHAVSGVDMLWLEMMKDKEHAYRAVRAAASSGLPIFLGISARRDQATGNVVLWGNGTDAVPLDTEWFNDMAKILGESLVGVNVMHTNFSTMAETLRWVREDCNWTGALGAYPDHGAFEAPNWVFYELDNSKAVEYVQNWVDRFGVQLVGGCCGLGPEYITALSAQMRRHNATVRQRNQKSHNVDSKMRDLMIEAVFNVLDKDNDGIISLGEVHLVLGREHMNAPEKIALDQLIRKSEWHGKDAFNIAEFKQILQGKAISLGIKSIAGMQHSTAYDAGPKTL